MPPEIRTLNIPDDLRVERRDGENGGEPVPQIVGHAAVFEQWTTLYDGEYYTWREKVVKGAFKRAIKLKQDVRALFNHDPNYVLGRTLNKTLTLSEDDIGLMSVVTPPDTQTIADLVLSPLERGDLSGMSFAFDVVPSTDTKETNKNGVRVIAMTGERITIRYEGEKRIEERELLDVDLYDVGPVTYPAYGGTDVALRYSRHFAARCAALDTPHTPERRHQSRRDPWLDAAWVRLRLATSGIR